MLNTCFYSEATKTYKNLQVYLMCTDIKRFNVTRTVRLLMQAGKYMLICLLLPFSITFRYHHIGRQTGRATDSFSLKMTSISSEKDHISHRCAPGVSPST